MKRKGMRNMLKLLIEKDKTDIAGEIAEKLVKSITFAAVDRKENEKYIVLSVTPLRKKRYARTMKKEVLKLVKKTVDTIVCYILFSMPSRYIREIVECELEGHSEYLDRNSVCRLINEGVVTRLKAEIKGNKKRSWYTAIYKRALENMLESGIFAVSSFIRFRIDDFKKCISEHTYFMLASISDEIKYMEFIATLQHLVDDRNPKLYELKVNVDSTGYTLTDGNNAPIDISLYETAKKDGIDKDDLLIGILLVAAPVRIRVCAEDGFFDSDLFSTMSNIFGDRIVVDYARNGK